MCHPLAAQNALQHALLTPSSAETEDDMAVDTVVVLEGSGMVLFMEVRHHFNAVGLPFSSFILSFVHCILFSCSPSSHHTHSYSYSSFSPTSSLSPPLSYPLFLSPHLSPLLSSSHLTITHLFFPHLFSSHLRHRQYKKRCCSLMHGCGQPPAVCLTSTLAVEMLYRPG